MSILKKLFAPKNQDSLIFEITLRCNLNCLHCYNVCKNETPYPSGELGTEETKKLLDKAIKESRCNYLTFTGGEPYLREDIFEIMSHVKNKVSYINVISNGTLLDAEKIKKSIDCGVKIFELPLLSSYRDIHNSMSRFNGFDKVTESISQIKALGGRVVTVFVATKENLHTWEETIEMAVALGADGLMFNRFNPGGEGRKNMDILMNTPEELSKALEIANNAVEKYNISIACSIAMHPCLFDTSRYPNLGFGFCAAGTQRAYYTIDPLGNLRMCNHSQIILGNLLNSNFWELARNKASRDFVKAMPKFCTDCKKAKECLGGCKASAEVCYGSPCEEDPFLRANKSLVKKF